MFGFSIIFRSSTMRINLLTKKYWQSVVLGYYLCHCIFIHSCLLLNMQQIKESSMPTLNTLPHVLSPPTQRLKNVIEKEERFKFKFPSTKALHHVRQLLVLKV